MRLSTYKTAEDKANELEDIIMETIQKEIERERKSLLKYVPSILGVSVQGNTYLTGINEERIY